jgi:hypothetical protein
MYSLIGWVVVEKERGVRVAGRRAAIQWIRIHCRFCCIPPTCGRRVADDSTWRARERGWGWWGPNWSVGVHSEIFTQVVGADDVI